MNTVNYESGADFHGDYHFMETCQQERRVYEGCRMLIKPVNSHTLKVGITAAHKTS